MVHLLTCAQHTSNGPNKSLANIWLILTTASCKRANVFHFWCYLTKKDCKISIWIHHPTHTYAAKRSAFCG